MPEIVCREEAFKIMGVCFEVHNEEVSGFVEAVYQECLEVGVGSELQSMPFAAQPQLSLASEGRKLTQKD